jgi:hypothetical protein
MGLCTAIGQYWRKVAGIVKAAATAVAMAAGTAAAAVAAAALAVVMASSSSMANLPTQYRVSTSANKTTATW